MQMDSHTGGFPSHGRRWCQDVTSSLGARSPIHSLDAHRPQGSSWKITMETQPSSQHSPPYHILSYIYFLTHSVDASSWKLRSKRKETACPDHHGILST